jgi:hypothetical protein
MAVVEIEKLVLAWSPLVIFPHALEFTLFP